MYAFGRVTFDLRDMEKEVTHNLWRNVENGKGMIHTLITISATVRGDSPSNLINWEDDLDRMKEEWIHLYVSYTSFQG